MRRRMLSLSMAVALVTIPGGVAAQACIGIPVAESHNALTAQVGFPENARAYGADFRHNMEGPLSLSAGYTMGTFDGVDTKQHGINTQANYEVPGLSFSACPTVGLGYTTVSEDELSLSTFSIPVGVGFGQSFELSSDLSVNPYVVPQLVWTRASFDVEGEESFSDSDSAFAAVFGATLALPRFYVGGGVTWYNEDNTDAVFSIMAGMPF